MQNFNDRVNFIWSVAELIRDAFKRSKYQDVILPFTLLRRIDCVLEPTKEHVLERQRELKGKLKDLDPQLRRASGFAFYNTSPFTFERLLADAPNQAYFDREVRPYVPDAWINSAVRDHKDGTFGLALRAVPGEERATSGVATF